jgi:2-polyprenyl-3-methyl-5-hydroxy-6-metoxy-1,4-benzoquinol methylase
VRCSCGLVFKRSETATQKLSENLRDADHYDAAYFRRYERRRRRRIAKSRRQILDALEVAPRGRLLDVGCSLGYALEAARTLGLDADGIDLSSHAIEHCRGLGFDAKPGTLTAIPASDATYSVAILKHVFEHTPEPRKALAELKRVLVPGGALFFAVPNANYFKARRSPQTSRFFRGEAGRAHFVYYSPATLSQLLESEGFRIASIHPRIVHRRAGMFRWLPELAVLPLRLPLRAAAGALGLRKEFWLVAVRT